MISFMGLVSLSKKTVYSKEFFIKDLKLMGYKLLLMVNTKGPLLGTKERAKEFLDGKMVVFTKEISMME